MSKKELKNTNAMGGGVLLVAHHRNSGVRIKGV